ncbi:patr class I histocompatibility antigen, A-126 alpha chain-like [Chanos chanos]|uniref:Patr class I histocompatibility antigen, A-126 alpha chain-like n=1 Tax=Chanos chanos TaxID=29144 RepID=A0A6J2UQY8_CHACN|nr:patr class I histocompatibility antigen, A-126 alpha chain-like [Chanos chanos]
MKKINLIKVTVPYPARTYPHYGNRPFKTDDTRQCYGEAGSHSLYAFATYIAGETQFPEFSAVLMMDDVQVGYYDSIKNRLIHCIQNTSQTYDVEEQEAGVVFGDTFKDMKYQASYLRSHFNDTDGFGVYQRILGCEMSDRNEHGHGRIKLLDAFSGFNLQELNLNMQQGSFLWNTESVIEWNTEIQTRFKRMVVNLCHPCCIKFLKKYLQNEKRYLLRKVKPRVRLLKKTLTNSAEIQITCVATGFYPRHINLTILRDGQPVVEDQIIGGMLLPNGDGTYQMRKSLEVSVDEIRAGHSYTCSASHLSLDNKLDISIASTSLPMVISVLVLVSVLMIPIFGYNVWRRCAGAKQRCGFGYAAASSECMGF